MVLDAVAATLPQVQREREEIATALRGCREATPKARGKRPQQQRQGNLVLETLQSAGGRVAILRRDPRPRPNLPHRRHQHHRRHTDLSRLGSLPPRAHPKQAGGEPARTLGIARPGRRFPVRQHQGPCVPRVCHQGDVAIVPGGAARHAESRSRRWCDPRGLPPTRRHQRGSPGIQLAQESGCVDECGGVCPRALGGTDQGDARLVLAVGWGFAKFVLSISCYYTSKTFS